MKVPLLRKWFRSVHQSVQRLMSHPDRRIYVNVFLILTILTAVLVLMFPATGSLQFEDLQEGSISTRRVVAPFDFEILKTPEEYEADREMAAKNVYPVFQRDESVLKEVLNRTGAFFDLLSEYRSRNASARQTGLRVALRDSLIKNYNIETLNTENWFYLLDSKFGLNDRDFQSLQYNVEQVIRDELAIGIMDRSKDQIANPDRRLIMLGDQEENIHMLSEFMDMAEARNKTTDMLANNYPRRTHLARIGFAIVNFFIRPNCVYAEAVHQQRIASAVARVPMARGFVQENEMIVDRNAKITPEIRKKLISLAAKMEEMGMQHGGIERVLHVLGRIMFVLVLLSALGVFLYLEKPNVLRDAKSLLLIAIVIGLIGFIAFLFHRIDASPYLVPVAMGAMVMAMVFDVQIGYASAAVLSLMTGALWGNAFDLMVVAFIVGVLGVLLITRIRSRSQLIFIIFYLSGGYIFTISMMGWIRGFPTEDIVRTWPWGLLSGLIAPIFTYGFLPLVESFFDVTTDFTLLELSNLNHPLLKRLSMEATGTYHHAIMVGNLAEAGAQSVGANSLLARVGSYYHDVGKMDKAEYFVENQGDSQNPHDRLTPRMSALILRNHVKKGIDLADQYRLPKAVKDIIPQHQGTLRMSFFFKKAMARGEEEKINENDYRYPGPKPQTKEAAIVMLADAVEAASRSMKDPTHSRLKGLIEEIVDERFQSGELDESPLTLRDLQRIKEQFLKILAGTFHARIEYPNKDEDNPPSKDDKSREARDKNTDSSERA